MSTENLEEFWRSGDVGARNGPCVDTKCDRECFRVFIPVRDENKILMPAAGRFGISLVRKKKGRRTCGRNKGPSLEEGPGLAGVGLMGL